ncbi:Ca2+-dependent phosphoinositide-specific phospholipase C [Gluconacetobacter sacchari]|uniref:Acid phosphatase n=2 Tax=Gluconacetobacter sacchari TaxID=92759 RepID=A0A7W4IBE1_9PROT|nr:Ca2+-dependent phosphoinositide-specific phospholipase C [Gluconacetobacter sacchari]MBB2159774.1 hypothetical protein [Gluconacetobacter sacchari]
MPVRFPRRAGRAVGVGLAVLLAAWARPGAAGAEEGMRLDQIQVIGSHNSYHAGLAPSIAALLARRDPRSAQGLDYAHADLPTQFDHGIRQIELDIYADTAGGRFAHPKTARWLAEAGLPPADTGDGAVMRRPGFKVMHIPDIDQRATCQPLLACLRQVRAWSLAHPGHLPLFVLLEIEQGARAPLTEPEPFAARTFDALDGEVRSVFAPGDLLTPDQVRGDAPSLRAAVAAHGWPAVAAARGKIVFLLDQRSNRDLYLAGHPGLRGRMAFTNAPPDADDAAFTELNDGPPEAIAALVRRHMLVRTRADANTMEARRGDPARRDAALASGAQLVSTDYPDFEPARWTGYRVGLETGLAARCNPVSAPAGCRDAAIEPRAPEAPRLRRLVLVMRHGLRSPLADQVPSRTVIDHIWPEWSGTPGDLTEAGVAQMRGLGAWERVLMAGNDGTGMAAAGCPAPGALRLRANASRRTIASAEAFAAGFAPGCPVPVVHGPIGVPDGVFSPLEADGTGTDLRALLPRLRAEAAAVGLLAGPPREGLSVLRRLAGCPGRGTFCADDSAPAVLDVDGSGRHLTLSGSLLPVSSAAEAIMLGALSDLPASRFAWGVVDDRDLARLSQLHAAMLHAMTGLSALAPVLSRPLGAAIAADLARADGPALTVWMGHDGTIIPLLTRLGVHVHAPGYAMDDVPTGSALGFALLTDARGGHPAVRVQFQSQTPDGVRDGRYAPDTAYLALPGCGGAVACPLATFTHLLEGTL